jgi:phosphatidate phosphatase APP1
MTREKQAPADSVAGATLHLAARIEDAVHAFREARGRRKGRLATVIPFTGYGGTGWVRVLGRVVLVRRDAPRADRFTNLRGWRSFTNVPVRDAEVTVEAGGRRHVVRADRGGVLDARVEAQLDPGWQFIIVTVEGRDPVTIPVFIVGPDVRFGFISDIDDTVMVTSLPRPFLAAWNTFVLDEHARRPVTGMSVLYERLVRAHPGAPFLYLSTGAWNVAPTLDRFLSRNLYPAGPLLLTDWGPTHDRWFRSGPAHKRDNLVRLAEEFPEVRWLLIGDDGQHDPAIYGDFAAAHPANVAAVAIRQLTVGEAVFAGGRTPASEHDEGAEAVPWLYSPDGAGLAEQLVEHGLL